MRILAVLAVLVVSALAAAVAALPYIVDWEAHRPKIESAISEATGREVAIVGPITFKLIPRPLLKVADLVVTGDQGEDEPPQLTAELAEIGLDPWSLLTGQVAVEGVSLWRPRVILSQPPVQGDPLADAAAPSNWLRTLARWPLAWLKVTDGELVVDQGGEDETPLLLDRIDLDLQSNGANGPMALSLNLALRERIIALDGEIGAANTDGASSFSLEVEASGADAAPIAARANGVVAWQDVPGRLSGSIDVEGPDLAQGLRSLTSMVSDHGMIFGVAPEQPFSLAGRFSVTPDAVQADNVLITIGDGSGRASLHVALPQKRIDLVLDLPKVVIAEIPWPEHEAPSRAARWISGFVGRLDLRLREIVYGSDSVRQMAIEVASDHPGELRVERVRARLPGGLEVRVQAPAGSSSARLTAVGSNVASTLAWLGVDLEGAALDFRTISVGGDLNLVGRRVDIGNLDIRLDGTAIQGRVGIGIAARPRLDLALRADRLDLDRYLPGLNEIDLALALLGRMLAKVDGSVDVTLERLIAKRLRFDSLTTQATLDQGRMTIERIAVGAPGDTTLSLEGRLDFEARSASLVTRVASRLPGRMLRPLELDLPISLARLKPVELSGRISGWFDQAKIDAAIDYDAGQMSIKGDGGWQERALSYDLALGVSHPDFRQLFEDLGLVPPMLAEEAPGALRLAGRVRHDPAGEDHLVVGSVVLGPSTITGRIAVTDAGIRPFWQVKLSLDEPRAHAFDPFLRLSGLQPIAALDLRPMIGRWPAIGVDLTWLGQQDAEVEFSATGGMAGSGVDLIASLRDGLLRVDAFEAALLGGEVVAEVSVEMRRGQPTLALAADLKSVDANALVTAIGIDPILEGDLGLQVELSAAGATPQALARSLSGEIEMNMESGRLHGAEIASLRRALAPGPAAPGPVAVASDDLFTMPLFDLEAQFTTKRGIAQIAHATMELETGSGRRVQADLHGAADLFLWAGDLSLAFDQGDQDDQGEEPIRLRIVGPLAAPQTFVASGSGKGRFENGQQ